MLFAAGSCTIEKQLYSKGFHVEFHKRKPSVDSHNSNCLVTEIPESDQETISSDSITDAPLLKEKEDEVVSELTKKKIIPVIKLDSVKSKVKTAANRIRTGISIQTHFSESLMSKSVKKDPKKRSEKRDIDIDWGEVAGWVLCIGGLIGLICIGAQAPGVSIGAVLLGVLVVVVVILLIALLIANALDGFDYWFWSGR